MICIFQRVRHSTGRSMNFSRVEINCNKIIHNSPACWVKMNNEEDIEVQGSTSHVLIWHLARCFGSTNYQETRQNRKFRFISHSLACENSLSSVSSHDSYNFSFFNYFIGDVEQLNISNEWYNFSSMRETKIFALVRANQRRSAACKLIASFLCTITVKNREMFFFLMCLSSNFLLSPHSQQSTICDDQQQAKRRRQRQGWLFRLDTSSSINVSPTTLRCRYMCIRWVE